MRKNESVKLCDVVKIQQSCSPITSDRVWLLNLDMVEQQTGRIIDYYYTDRTEIGNSTIQFDENNVLYSKLRPNLNKVVCPSKSGFASSELLPLLPDKSLITREYLTEYLRSSYFVEWAVSKTAGAKMPRLAPKELLNKVIPLPPLETQKQIAATLDKAIHSIDLCNAILEKLDLLVKARFVELFGEPIDNPMGWKIKPLKELSLLITNGNTPKGGSENYVDSGIIFLRSQNVWRNRIDLSDVAYIDEATNQKMRKSIVKHKDILITKTGRINTENSSLGRAALYLGEDDSANINGHVYLVRLNDTVVPEFVVTILTGEAYRKYIRKVCVGGIDKRQINLDQVEDFPIILPPIEKQAEFANVLNQINKTKFAVQQVLSKAETLKKALMQEYFG